MATLTPDDTLLGLLAFRQQHGYQLLEVFREPAQLGCVWNLSVSQLYAVLKRLDAQGYIQGREVSSTDAPDRTEYTLTESGNARLKNWLSESRPCASIRSVRVEFLSRLFVARLLNLPTLDLIRWQKATCYQKRTDLIAQRDAAQPGVGYLALDLQIAQLDAIMKWIDRCELTPREMEHLCDQN
jgi:DNA-binding PadR family transcriptional regulator